MDHDFVKAIVDFRDIGQKLANKEPGWEPHIYEQDILNDANDAVEAAKRCDITTALFKIGAIYSATEQFFNEAQDPDRSHGAEKNMLFGEYVELNNALMKARANVTVAAVVAVADVLASECMKKEN